jgi:hypothetical protein
MSREIHAGLKLFCGLPLATSTNNHATSKHSTNYNTILDIWTNRHSLYGVLVTRDRSRPSSADTQVRSRFRRTRSLFRCSDKSAIKVPSNLP